MPSPGRRQVERPARLAPYDHVLTRPFGFGEPALAAGRVARRRVVTRSTPPRWEGCRPASRGLTLELMTVSSAYGRDVFSSNGSAVAYPSPGRPARCAVQDAARVEDGPRAGAAATGCAHRVRRVGHFASPPRTSRHVCGAQGALRCRKVRPHDAKSRRTPEHPGPPSQRRLAIPTPCSQVIVRPRRSAWRWLAGRPPGGGSPPPRSDPLHPAGSRQARATETAGRHHCVRGTYATGQVTQALPGIVSGPNRVRWPRAAGRRGAGGIRRPSRTCSRRAVRGGCCCSSPEKSNPVPGPVWTSPRLRGRPGPTRSSSGAPRRGGRVAVQQAGALRWNS